MKNTLRRYSGDRTENEVPRLSKIEAATTASLTTVRSKSRFADDLAGVDSNSSVAHQPAVPRNVAAPKDAIQPDERGCVRLNRAREITRCIVACIVARRTTKSRMNFINVIPPIIVSKPCSLFSRFYAYLVTEMCFLRSTANSQTEPG